MQQEQSAPEEIDALIAGLGGTAWRAIDVHEGDDLDLAALQALVREAAALNRARAA